MSHLRTDDERSRILTFWWMLELFSPQSVPKVTRRSTRPPDQQVIEWHRGGSLPWEVLAPPEPVGGARRVWRHTIYLGIYDLEATYESLHRVFGDDADAYDDRPGGQSACAGLLIDQDGRLVAGSAVLSSALWAVARIHDPGPRDPRWMHGFDQALETFGDAIDEYEGERRATPGDEQPPPYDGESLYGLLPVAHAGAGIGGFEDLATDRMVIASTAVSARRSDESPDTHFLNSFFLNDLAAVREQVGRGNFGPALAAYLTSDQALPIHNRVDVVDSPHVVDDGTMINHLPHGRWPSNPRHALALSQQFAVNQALNNLGPSAGLMGVNGPPGTGKTTMLRDILAGNIVERAHRLAALRQPQDAFTETTHKWTANEGYPRVVRQLRTEFTGFEMVVASANNTAVENLTTEIPARKAIEQPWRDKADYFGEIATEILREVTNDDQSILSDPPTAWGLVAARLGKKRNRADFHSAFWFDNKDPRTGKSADDGVARMQTRLKRWCDGVTSQTPG